MRRMTSLFVSMTLSGGIAVAGMAAADLPALVASSAADAEAVARRSDCRTVDLAILAYVSDHGVPPADVAQLSAYADGDLTAYRVRDGHAVGPGCPARA